MAKKVNIIIPSSLSDVFEEFVMQNSLNKYERFAYNSPLSTRYKMGKNDLFSTVLSIHYNSSVQCSAENRDHLLFCIARDLLDPITDVNP